MVKYLDRTQLGEERLYLTGVSVHDLEEVRAGTQAAHYLLPALRNRGDQGAHETKALMAKQLASLLDCN